MRIIAISNQKGGCGKTLTAINLSACIARRGRKVLLVDLDPQAHASLGLGLQVDDLPSSMYNALTEMPEHQKKLSEVTLELGQNLWLAPSNLLLSTVEQELAGKPGREERLLRSLTELEPQFDYVILDCPPSTSILTFNALVASWEVIIPIEMSVFSLHGLIRLLEIVSMVRDRLGRPVSVRGLATMYDKRTRFSHQILEEIKRAFADDLFRTVIRHCTRLREAASAGKAITEYDADSIGYEDYSALAQEVLMGEGVLLAGAEQVSEEENAAPAVVGRDPSLEAILQQEMAEEVRRKESSTEVVERLIQEISSQPPAAPIVAEPVALPEESVTEVDDSQDSDTLLIDPPGGVWVALRLHAPNANEVLVAGEFNSWMPGDGDRMQRGEDGVWRIEYHLEPGLYQYKFIADGSWLCDPENTDRVGTPFGDCNSVIRVE